MKKNIKLLLILLIVGLICILLFLFVKKDNYTVEFKSEEKEVLSITVKEGEIITRPDDPIKEGYLFDGWYYNNNLYDFSNKVNKDIVLRARWKEKNQLTDETFLIKFNTDGGNTINDQIVNIGSKIIKPDDPIKNGYTFEGWYKNDVAYDFILDVSSNITLVAKWKKIENGKSINLSSKNINLEKDTKTTLIATLNNLEGTVEWKTSNANVATVSKSGVVSGINVGIATITATVGNISSSCTVNITLSATDIIISPPTLAMDIGDSQALTVIITPSNTTDKIKWSSSDNSVATINNGLITAVGAGTATIKATIGSINKTVTVTVNAINNPVSGVSLDKENMALVIGENSSGNLVATITPNNATNKNLTWTSSDPAVATVDNNGKVTAIGIGNAIITVKTNDGNKTDSCNISVTKKEDTYTYQIKNYLNNDQLKIVQILKNGSIMTSGVTSIHDVDKYVINNEFKNEENGFVIDINEIGNISQVKINGIYYSFVK